MSVIREEIAKLRQQAIALNDEANQKEREMRNSMWAEAQDSRGSIYFILAERIDKSFEAVKCTYISEDYWAAETVRVFEPNSDVSEYKIEKRKPCYIQGYIEMYSIITEKEYLQLREEAVRYINLDEK